MPTTPDWLRFVTPETLAEIEQTLNEPTFAGVPLGATLGSIYHIELYIGHGQWDWLTRAKQYAQMWREQWRSHYRGGQGVPPQPDKQTTYLFTLQKQTPRFTDLVLPVVEKLDPANCVIIGRERHTPTNFPAEATYLPWAELPSLDLAAWRKEFNQKLPEWQRRLAQVLAANNLPSMVSTRLLSALVTQSQRVMACQNLLKQVNPAAVIVEYDRNANSACLVLAARQRNIPTMTMVHGVFTEAQGYVPLLADVAFCWGERMRQLFIAAGTAPERLIVTGCQRLSRQLTIEQAAARAKHGLALDKPVVLLATNPIKDTERLQIAEAFCLAFNGQERIQPCIRLHPAEALAFYTNLASRYPYVRFLENSSWSLDEAMAVTDVVVVQDSGFGNDALVKAKPVVVLDVTATPLQNGQELISQAGCPRADNPVTLLAISTRIIDDPNFNQELQAQATEYLHTFCLSFGEDAAQHIANQISNRINTSTDSA